MSQRNKDLDNSKTSQKPQAVIGALAYFQSAENCSVPCRIHGLSETATLA